MGAELFASPFTVALALLIVLASSSVYYAGRQSPLIPKRRLFAGYASVILTCTVLVAVSAYVSPEEAASKWQVPQERYWAVLTRHFLTSLVLLGSAAVVGIATIGLPIVATLDKARLATIPHVLAATVPVSAVAAILLSSGDVTPFQHLALTLAHIIGTHLTLALSFCLGAGLPWRRRSHSREA